MVSCVYQSRAARETHDSAARATRAAAPPRAQRAPRGAGNGGRRQGPRREVTLDDKYVLEEGRILLTGVQALVRLPLDQHRADRRRGLNTGTLSPATRARRSAASTRSSQRNRELLRRAPRAPRARASTRSSAPPRPGAASSPASCPAPRYDGVLGIWYGKAPGLDRAADALRHGNFVGVSRTGGVLALVGDDPSCKSSTLPSASEALLASLHMPVFFPGNVQEVLDLGLHALACSRASGLWVGFKIVTNVADAVGTAEVAPDRVAPGAARGHLAAYEHVPNGNLLAPASLEMERTLLGLRTDLALAYARENGVNRIEGAARRLARHRRRRQDLLRPAPGAAQPRPRRARARARRRPDPQARHDLAARAARSSASSPAASTRSSSSRRRARSSRRQLKDALYGTAGRAARSSASATSAASRCCPPSSTSTPT